MATCSLQSRAGVGVLGHTEGGGSQKPGRRGRERLLQETKVLLRGKWVGGCLAGGLGASPWAGLCGCHSQCQEIHSGQPRGGRKSTPE